MPPNKPLNAFYFLSGVRDTASCSYTWRVGARSTSFYVKPVYAALAAFKISLHGPDPRPALLPGLRFGVDASAGPVMRSSGGTVVQRDLPNGQKWFKGEDAEGKARLAVRFRVTSDLFGDRIPPAPRPTKNLKASSRGYLIPPPPLGSVNDVEIYVAPNAPYWPHETRARLEDACIGPIRNDAGQFLTGLSIRRSVDDPVDPPKGMSQRIEPGKQSIRAVNARVDDHEVLWVLEEWMPRTFFEPFEMPEN